MPANIKSLFLLIILSCVIASCAGINLFTALRLSQLEILDFKPATSRLAVVLPDGVHFSHLNLHMIGTRATETIIDASLDMGLITNGDEFDELPAELRQQNTVIIKVPANKVTYAEQAQQDIQTFIKSGGDTNIQMNLSFDFKASQKWKDTNCKVAKGFVIKLWGRLEDNTDYSKISNRLDVEKIFKTEMTSSLCNNAGYLPVS